MKTRPRSRARKAVRHVKESWLDQTYPFQDDPRLPEAKKKEGGNGGRFI